MNLDPGGCCYLGMALHELGHALGRWHEQQRNDALENIVIHWDNIHQMRKWDYTRKSAADTSLPYDVESVMHYSAQDWAIGSAPTMTALEPGLTMGNRIGLSPLDGKKLGKAYGCESEVDFTLCTNDDEKMTEGNCICHQDIMASQLVFKKTVVQGDKTGYRCVLQCPDFPADTNIACDCPKGRAIIEWNSTRKVDFGVFMLDVQELRRACYVGRMIRTPLPPWFPPKKDRFGNGPTRPWL